jgi:hypothetical protein
MQRIAVVSLTAVRRRCKSASAASSRQESAMRIEVGVAKFMKLFRRKRAEAPLAVVTPAPVADAEPAPVPVRPVFVRPVRPQPAARPPVEPDDFEPTRQHELGSDYDPYAPTTPMPLHGPGGRGEPSL